MLHFKLWNCKRLKCAIQSFSELPNSLTVGHLRHGCRISLFLFKGNRYKLNFCSMNKNSFFFIVPSGLMNILSASTILSPFSQQSLLSPWFYLFIFFKKSDSLRALKCDALRVSMYVNIIVKCFQSIANKTNLHPINREAIESSKSNV